MPAVFISYSRKDYYFAESLAFHLAHSGVDAWLDANHLAPGSDWAADIDRALTEAKAFVLVLTPDSLRSEYVRSEWQRALEQGDRIILALFRRCIPPPELQNAEVVDFRGAFGPAVRRLTQLLSSASTASSRKRVPRLPRVPPWVGIITALLASLFTLPLVVFGRWDDVNFANEPLAFRIFAWIVLPFFVGFIVWHTCVAFVRRRMGMTRLALSLAAFTGLFAFNLLQHFGASIYPALLAGGTSPFAHERWPAAAGLVVIGLCGLAVVCLLRPADLLRWSPTGKAWDVYRRGRVAKVPDITARFAELTRLHLLHDTEDAAAAARLRDELTRAGGREVGPDDGDATRVLLLTNRTRTAWLEEQANALQHTAVTIVGTAIALPDSLRWLWRRQWVDFRRWDARRERREPVPAVPEALTRLRIPSVVNRTQHLLCATGGLMFATGGALLDKQSSGDLLTFHEAVGAVVAYSSLAWCFLAWRLVHRKSRELSFKAGVLALSLFTLLFGTIALYLWVTIYGSAWRIIIPALFLVAGPLLLRRQLPALRFWLLGPLDRATKSAARLTSRRNWQAILWLLLYAAAWMLFLNVQS